jgi:Rps23 Pro-64 3,4-dihydroxylase Tpa1-like proline 4-hydroxylase
MFEIATRTKMRFPFKGMVSVEDLWDLSVKDLDSIFKTLNAQVKKSQEESLLTTKTKEDETLATQIEIVKHIVKTKLDEVETAKQSKELKEKKQKIMEIIAAKQDESLHNASVEELQAMLANLG